MSRPDDTDDIVYVPSLEAYERLELLTGRTRQQVQQDIRDGLYPWKRAPGGGRLIGIPAHAPPTLSDQLAAERERSSVLQAERDDLAAQVEALVQEVADLKVSNSRLSDDLSRLREQFADEIDYRAYLVVTLRTVGGAQSQGDITHSMLPMETVSLIPPAEGDGDREVMLKDGRTVVVSSRILSVLRSYVQEYVRVYGRKKFTVDFHISPMVLLRWEEGHTGFMVPVRILDHLGTEPGTIIAASGVLRGMDSEVPDNGESVDRADPDEGWKSTPSDEAPRAVSVRPAVSDEAAAYGREVAHLIDRWRNLRSIVYTPRGPSSDDLIRENDLLCRVNLLRVELELLGTHGMAIMGGGSGHPLDRVMWDEKGFEAEIRWRKLGLEDARQLLADERRRNSRRLPGWLWP